jgi:hypothetical protein
MADRRCGDCTLCCRLLAVKELDKPANMRCSHQSSRGCAIYRQFGFPASCALWSCRWLVNDDTADMQRPDRCGYVIDIVPDMVRTRYDTGEAVDEIIVIPVWVRPGTDRHRLDPALKRYAERQAAQGNALLLRDGASIATAVFAPSMAADGEWHFVDSGDMQRVQTQTGNLLLDKLKEATTA